MKYSNKHTGRLCFVLMLSQLLSGVAFSQPNSIIGTSTLARDCYQASQVAVRTGFSSQGDLESCNNAIIYGDLNNRDTFATYVNRGILKVALEDYTGGKADYEKAMALQPNKAAEAHINRGNLWLMAKKYDRAIEDYYKALEMNVKRPYIAVLNIGLAYEYLGEITKAQEYYEKALLAFPEWPIAVEKLNRVNLKIQRMTD